MNPAIILTWIVGISSFLAGGTAAGSLTDLFDASTAKRVAAAAGLIGGCCAVPLGYFVTKSQQASFVLKNIEEPKVKSSVVTAVSNLPGINPLQLNEQADRTLIDLGANKDVTKVLSPKS